MATEQERSLADRGRRSHLKVCTSGTSLRLWPRILWTSFAAALSIFSTRFSCSCSSWV